ncbi:MAG TPA: aldehyde ferredoxin oxidoreductase N-terminal domain-containing protein, partial [Thermoleophilia bacterium]|nr:aldehyde ferredoxin oxidoreductase N-terminal domain-containing protein [Thermoleophilia bacterium]
MRKLLIVDLSTHTWQVEEIEIAGLFGLGGKVLGLRLLEKYLNPDADPLAAENVLVITPSPVSAYGMSGSDRFGAFSRSPLTGIWLEAYCGGSFARTLRETGWDAMTIRGASQTPVRVHLTASRAEILGAEDLWGKDTATVEEELLSQLGRRSAMLSIGVAGEKLVRIASVMHEQAHALGRGGMGAVFGSKKLKALSVTSPGPAKMEPQEQFVATRREIAKLATDSPTAYNYRTFGTPVMVALLNETGAFPADFFTRGAVDHRATLEAEHWPEWAKIERDTCPPCPMRCRKRLILTEGAETG